LRGSSTCGRAKRQTPNFLEPALGRLTRGFFAFFAFFALNPYLLAFRRR